MSLRQLLNAAHSALSFGLEEKELAALDDELEADPNAIVVGRRKHPAGTGNLRALMAAAKMPQAGAARPRTEGGQP